TSVVSTRQFTQPVPLVSAGAPLPAGMPGSHAQSVEVLQPIGDQSLVEDDSAIVSADRGTELIPFSQGQDKEQPTEQAPAAKGSAVSVGSSVSRDAKGIPSWDRVAEAYFASEKQMTRQADQGGQETGLLSVSAGWEALASSALSAVQRTPGQIGFALLLG